MTMQEACQQGEKLLMQAGIPDARLDAWYLLEHITGVSRAMYYAKPDQELSEEQTGLYLDFIGRRAAHIPLQHLTGEQEFMGLTFHVNKHVLIPRQDTEAVVEEALRIIAARVAFISSGRKTTGQENKSFRLLDMCTGSGCILLSLIHHAGMNKACGSLKISGTGLDISEEALKVARANAESLHIEAEFRQSDLFEAAKGRYELIVSNPPYIRTEEIEALQDEVKGHDPRIALDGKEDGLYFYRKITSEAGTYLEDGGSLVFEIGFDQGEDVSRLMQEAGFRNIMVKKDLAGLDRAVIGVYDR